VVVLAVFKRLSFLVPRGVGTIVNKVLNVFEVNILLLKVKSHVGFGAL
jgi:hypothetical protein